MTDFLSRVRKFDAYPKTLEDFRERTMAGAAVSIIAGLFMLILFATELYFYLSVQVQPELFVDTSRNEKMRINVDIVFHAMPCAYLSIDVMDISGEQQLDVDHNLFKKRLSSDGEPIREEEEQPELGDKSHQVVNALKSLNQTLDPNRCESCYGAESPEVRCCNDCEKVREAYRKKGWAFDNADGIVQCEREGWSDKLKKQANEGCSVYGYLHVNKVAGNFHFAPGKSFQQHNVHIHDLQPFGRTAFNLSHTVRRLSFGHDYPGLVNPLDGHQEIADKQSSVMYQYFLKIVPTRYYSLHGKETSTNQYSVTMHQKHINHALGEHGLPGVFFMFEISPILVQLREYSPSFFHFLTGVCAIIGGVFTVAGMVDGIIHHSLKIWKKQQEGKLG
eukprot:m.52557 g.52557  ORF g.52557 m.52557 type:complete len:390 (-) comp15340_c0_seq1:31-1200(-)